LAKHDTVQPQQLMVFTCVLNRVRSENFQKNVSDQQVVCLWTWSKNETGYIWSILGKL